MTDFNTLKDTVKKKGFGTALYGNVNGAPVYLSRGVREAYLGDGTDIQPVISAVTEFENGNYGSAAEHGKAPSKGHEYGRYAVTEFENSSDEDDALWIHKDGKAIIVYFAFER